MQKILRWLDENVLTVFAGFLLVFIPLYPKWPLFDILYGYNVRVRFEDFAVAFVFGVFLLQFLRRRVKIQFNKPVKAMFAYLAVGLVSSLVAIFVVHSVPMILPHIEKTFLHWLRRIEYFSLFLIVFTSIKSNRVVKYFIGLVFLTLVAVTVYGYGQKYLYWPAFSTMNREFSKGWWLYLTAHARVLSTFGGHYDLAGYLVITLTLAWSFLFGFKKLWQKIGMLVVIGTGFWLLILTASRISFLAYLLGLSFVILMWTFNKGLKWGITRWFVTIFLSILIMLSFGDLSDRFLHLFKLDTRIANLREALLNPSAQAPTNNAMFLENNLAAVANPSDVPPTPVKPSDVNGNEAPLFVPEKTASGATTLVQKPRTYSANAVMYDLSVGIRLDATWPLAIHGFLTNPVTGSGYATLNKQSTNEFTDAESTDNDYLRSLGETGLLGFITFFGSLLLFGYVCFRSLGGIRESWLYSLVAGYIGLVAGLLLNATLIDIFEASKVAYVFWGVTGLTAAAIYINRDKIKTSMKPLSLNFHPRETYNGLVAFLKKDILWVILICVLTVGLRFYKIDGPVADWHSWRQADTSSVTRNYDRAHVVNWLYPIYDDISSVASGKDNPMGLRMVEFPIYNALSIYVKYITDSNVEVAGRLTSALTMMLGVLSLFLIAKELFNRRIAYFASLTYTLLPFGIFYGRSILPDPTMVGFSLVAIYFSLRYLKSGRFMSLFVSILFATFALLVKPYAIFLLATIPYLYFAKYKFNWKGYLPMIITFAVALIPLFLWRIWISQFPQGIPASEWLLNGDMIRFKGAFWYWLFADRVGRLILGYWGLIPLGFGLIRKFEGKYRHFALVLLAGSFAYLAVFATGNVRHDYYQILILPSLSLLVGIGLDSLIFSRSETINPYIARTLAAVCIVFALAFGWYYVRDYYNINHPEIVEAGDRFEHLVENSKVKVIAPYNGDTAFLYQTGKQGWPIMEGSIDQMVKLGADYYVSVNFDDLTKQIISDSWPKGKVMPKGVIKKFTLLDQTDNYVIVQLVKDNQLPQ